MEYTALLVLVAAIVAALFFSGIAGTIGSGMRSAVDAALGSREGPGTAGPDSPSIPSEQEGEALPDGPVITTIPYLAPDAEPINPESTWPANVWTAPASFPETPASYPSCDPLCLPEEAPSTGNPFTARPPEGHSDTAIALDSQSRYATEEPKVTLCNSQVHSREPLCRVLEEARFAAYGGRLRGLPDAAELLHHFLNGSGEPYEIDFERFMDDVPEIEEMVVEHQAAIGEEAIAAAQEMDATEPITFPVNTAWEPWGYGPDGDFVYHDKNWANAIGSFHYNLAGEVTVRPPEIPGGEWTYEVHTQVNMEKYYDWDRDSTDVAVNFPPWPASVFSFSQQDLWELHTHGFAQEFWLTGRSLVSSSGGGR